MKPKEKQMLTTFKQTLEQKVIVKRFA